MNVASLARSANRAIQNGKLNIVNQWCKNGQREPAPTTGRNLKTDQSIKTNLLPM
jgi:hypothetical protein